MGCDSSSAKEQLVIRPEQPPQVQKPSGAVAKVALPSQAPTPNSKNIEIAKPAVSSGRAPSKEQKDLRDSQAGKDTKSSKEQKDLRDSQAGKDTKSSKVKEAPLRESKIGKIQSTQSDLKSSTRSASKSKKDEKQVQLGQSNMGVSPSKVKIDLVGGMNEVDSENEEAVEGNLKKTKKGKNTKTKTKVIKTDPKLGELIKIYGL